MNEQLRELSERYWDLTMATSPTWAMLIGDHRFDDQMEDLSREGEDRTIDSLREVVAAAERIDPIALTHDERVTRGVLISEAKGQADDLATRQAEFAVSPSEGFHIQILSLFPQLPVVEPDHAEALIAKYGKIGTTLDQAIERLHEGVANKRTPPEISVRRSILQIDEYLLSRVDTDPLLTVDPPPSFDEAATADWRNRLSTVISESVRPAYQRYRDVLEADVMPVARPPEESGLTWLPDGDGVYAEAVHRYTSLEMTPEQVHQIGLEEIEALGDEYRKLGRSVLGTDDLQRIYTRLRDDPALRFDSRTAVQEHAGRALDRAKEAMGEWFGRLPQADCILQPIPDEAANESPLAYYLPPAADGTRPGTFFINTIDPTTRTVYESEALTFHESIPGHHLQLTIAQELDHVPEFQRNALATAYVEGWGLYTERLADEMGLYSGEIDRLGILSFDSWRAGRLVVDTGIHAMGWSRQRAMDFFMENSPQAPNNIENEVDRYIAWPGQALAYKIGQREIMRLRRWARHQLGDQFDIRGFHDTVLGSGPVPLPILGDLVREWVTAAT